MQLILTWRHRSTPLGPQGFKHSFRTLCLLAASGREGFLMQNEGLNFDEDVEYLVGDLLHGLEDLNVTPWMFGLATRSARIKLWFGQHP